MIEYQYGCLAALMVWTLECYYFNIRVFAENLVGLGFLLSVSYRYKYVKSIPTHEKLIAVGKRGPNASSNQFFLGLGWSWVGEFVVFILICICFPTQQNLVNRKHHFLMVLSVSSNPAVVRFELISTKIRKKKKGDQLLRAPSAGKHNSTRVDEGKKSWNFDRDQHSRHEP